MAFRLPPSEFVVPGYRTRKTPGFSLKAKPNNLAKDRIGVIISVAAVKTAVRRNFFRRQVKAIIGYRVSGIAKFDFLVIMHKPVNQLTKMELKTELLGAVNRIFLKK